MADTTPGAPVPPDELIRYGVLWRGPTEPTCEPMEDGYWTPWHIAQARIAKAMQEREELAEIISKLLEMVERHWGDYDEPIPSGVTILHDRACAAAERLGGGGTDG